MKARPSRLFTIGLIAALAAPLTVTEAVAGGYYHGGHGHRGDHHGGYYRGNQVWAAVGVGLLGGALIAATRPAPVYYQQPPVVYVPPPAYVEPPVYVPPPAYTPPPTYLRYDPWCRCYR